MGTVFTATDDVTGGQVAVEVLNDEHLGNKEIRERFQQEADILRTLTHPEICAVLNTADGQGEVPYFVMPLLNGKSLASRVRGADEVPIGTTIHIIGRVLEALAFSHRCGVLHRDIKPSNVFVCDAASERPEVKLLDFGISKFASCSKSIV